jgi:LacI family transcriptional regulator
MSRPNDGTARPTRPTMKDVAALAGVAIKTVSRVMNDEPTVAPELAARVHGAAAKLGYRPNLTASSLRRGDRRTATIGLLLEDVANPFSAALLRAVEDVARQRGVQILIGSLDEDPERECQLAITLIDRGVDGLIVVPAARDQSYLAAERQFGTRVVFLDREPRLLEADAVVSGNRDGAVAATNHLRAHGHSRIAYLGDRLSIATATQRFDGYRHVLDRAGIAVDEQIVVHNLRTSDEAMAAALQILSLSEPPTAIFASQNLITMGVVRALRRAGRQDSVGLVGFDDFVLADALEPGVTVITQDVVTLGRRATELLFARLDGDETPPTTHVVKTGMIIRGSGEIALQSPSGTS